MPLVETLPIGADTAQWTVWGTVARVVVTDPGRLAEATALVRAELAAVDAACSRFRDDSELRYACRAGHPVRVSPLLADLVAAALRAAAETGGDVDPTVGAALCGLGYDRDFAAVTGRPVAAAVRVFPTSDWRSVRLRDRELTVPDGVLLDLGATAKAAAADRAAALISLRLGIGAMVALGGDIATAGPAPEGSGLSAPSGGPGFGGRRFPEEPGFSVRSGGPRSGGGGVPRGGWRVLVQDRPGDPSCLVRLPAGAALATSSTAARTWGRPGELLHHIVDPRTGRPAPAVWRTVSVAARSCVRANTLSTAAIVRGHGAFGLLGRAPSRLVTPGLDVLRRGGWPA